MLHAPRAAGKCMSSTQNGCAQSAITSADAAICFDFAPAVNCLQSIFIIETTFIA